MKKFLSYLLSASILLVTLQSFCFAVSNDAMVVVEGCFITNVQSDETKVIFYDTGGRRTVAEVFYEEGYGVYSATLSPGKYDIHITNPGSLPVNISNVRIANTDYTIPQIAMLSGDLTGDGKIDTKDFSVLLRGFDTSPEFENLRKIADIDGDGIVLVSDIALLKTNLGKTTTNIEWTNIMNLKCEYKTNPVTDERQPMLSWVLDSTKRGQKQTAYEIGVASSKELLANGDFDIWYSGKVMSNDTSIIFGNNSESVTVEGTPTEASTLLPATTYFWTVTAYNADGEAVKSSEIASFETGLFGDFGEDNMWIYHTDAANENLPSVLFRKQFTLEKPVSEVERARLYSTAAGNQIMYMNGQRASDEYMAPGKTQYTSLLYYQTYDILPFLVDGDNTVAAEVGQGWYNGGPVQAKFGTNVGLKAKLVVDFFDGTSQVIDTDDSWLCTNEGPTYTNRYYIGQKVDGRKYIENWNSNNSTDTRWKDVVASDTFRANKVLEGLRLPVNDVIGENLVAEITEPVRIYKELSAIKVTNPKNNVFVYDFGVNMAGTTRITAKAAADTVMTVKYGESLKGGYVNDKYEHNGEDSYIFRGDAESETVEFDLVYHGFRYVQIEGLSEALSEENITALFLSSDMELSGDFESSNEKLNAFEENVRNSFKGNYVSAITDCPTREKNMWSGDANLSAYMVSRMGGVYNMFRNLEEIFASSQRANGGIPELPLMSRLPDTVKTEGKTPAVYSDVIVQVPYEMYHAYGDERIIRDYYDNMKAWVDFLFENKIYIKDDPNCAGMELPYYIDPEKADYIRLDGNYGDHLSFHEGISGRGYYENEAYTTTYGWYDTSFAEVGTAWAAYSCLMLSEMAEVIGEIEDAAYYKEMHGKLAKGWRDNFVAEDGFTALSDGVTTVTTNADGTKTYSYSSDVTRNINGVSCKNLGTQSSYVFGLVFRLYENDEKARLAAANLAKVVENEGYAFTVGEAGMAYITQVLTEYGYFDIVSRAMEREENPSPLFQVKSGATTAWEGWDDTRSQNHIAFGTLAKWLYLNVLGIDHGYNALSPGYRHFVLAPEFASYEDAGITWAKGYYDSINGRIESAWELSADKKTFTYKCVVPANTSATLILPLTGGKCIITESGKDVLLSEGVKYLKTEHGKAYYEITSGVYSFKVEDDIQSAIDRLSGLDIICIGDSLTRGVNNVDGSVGKSYPEFLADMTGANVVNKGSSGYNTSLFWNNGVLKNIDFDGADIVLIMLGTNGGLTDTLDTDLVGDSYLDYADTYTGNYGKMIEYIKEKTTSETMIVLMTPPVASTSMRPVSQLEGVVNVVGKLADRYGLYVIDNYNSCGITMNDIEKYMPYDGLHCSEEGYELLADYICKKTAEYYYDFYPYDHKLNYVTLSEDEGDYYFLGRWYDKEVDGVMCKGTISSGSEIHFKIENTENVWIRLHSTTDLEPYAAVSLDGAIPVRIKTVMDGDTLIASGLDNGEHTIRVFVDGTHTYNSYKWIYGYGFNFEKAVVDDGGIITGIRPDHKVIAYFGDSITEGGAVYKALSPLPEHNSHTRAYPFYTSSLLGCVTYNAGYGAGGMTRNGTGSVPKCLITIDNLLEGMPFEMPVPDIIVINYGHNDPGSTSEEISNYMKEYGLVLDRLREKFPNTPIFAVPPFKGARFLNQIKQVALGRENVYVIDDTGWKYTTTDDAHPTPAGARAISQYLAPEIRYILGDSFFNQ